MWKGLSLQQIVQGKLDIQMQKNEIAPGSFSINKNQFKMDLTLKCKIWNYKIPTRKCEESFITLVLEVISCIWHQRTDNKRKINKWDDIKLRSFYTAKEITEWKDIMWNGI